MATERPLTDLHGPVTCLLVDDNEENLIALSALLRRDGVQLLQARSGAEALELLLVHDVALALLDVQMPEMDGFELAELMRGSERTRHVPIIFMTAGARDQFRVFQGYDLGAVDFLFKPIEAHILTNKAAVFFELYRQRRQLARELADRTEALRLNEMFTAVLGHDLRDPLNAIMAAAQVLPRLSAPGDVRASADRVVASARRMHTMIEGLLDLTRARLAGGIALERAPADLAGAVLRVVQEQRAVHPDRDIDFVCDGAGIVLGHWDAGRLAQVASNLIGNALQHGADGSVVHVRLDGTHPDMAVLSVTNTGTIDADAVPHLFEPFRAGRKSYRRSGGLGLGLYIVNHLVQAHDGDVDVVSSDERHTVFRVTIPRVATPRGTMEGNQ